jgi:hypothetical protein
MVVFFVGLIALIILIVYYLFFAGKKNAQGKDLGDPRAGTGTDAGPTHMEVRR